MLNYLKRTSDESLKIKTKHEYVSGLTLKITNMRTVFHQKDDDMRYIVIKESEYKDKILGLTTNGMLIIVNSDNKRIDEYVCPKEIWELYKNRIEDARNTPSYQTCLYFGKPYIGTEDDL